MIREIYIKPPNGPAFVNTVPFTMEIENGNEGIYCSVLEEVGEFAYKEFDNRLIELQMNEGILLTKECDILRRHNGHK